MSIRAPDVIVELVSLEAPLNDMANLKLGSSCTCDDPQNCQPNCPSKAISENSKKKSSPYPYFWRKTQLNPFVKSKNLSRRKISGTFEILQPSKLTFIVAPSTSSASVTISSSSGLGPSTSASVSLSTPTARQLSDSQIQCTSASTSNSPTNTLHTILRSSTQQQQLLLPPSTASGSGSVFLSSRPGTVTTLKLPVPRIITTRPMPIPGAGASAASTSLSLPDFATLSLRGDNSEPQEGGPGDSHAQSTSSHPANILESAVELSGALVHFKLDTSSNNSSNSRSRRNSRTPKWKSRIRGSFKQQMLPPILEDSSESSFLGKNAYNIHQCPQAPPSSPNLNCSQHALMETQSGTRWSQGGEPGMDSVDDVTIDELASYLDVFVYIPKKMSPMAEMMYT